jgi:large subunit ribosomal protein L18
MDKKQARIRRSARGRAKIRELGVFRLCVHRTPSHMYAQVIAPGASGDMVVASASTLDKSIRALLAGHAGNTSSAAAVGKVIAERAISAGVEKVAFDRSGFRYHGRVKALADAARESGLQF